MTNLIDDLANSASEQKFIEQGFLNLSEASAILADNWIPPPVNTKDNDPSKSLPFGVAFVASLNALITECVTGRIRAYNPESGLPIEMHGGNEFECDHNSLIKIDAFLAWAENNGIDISSRVSEPDYSDKPLTTTERNTLLTIIAALCDYSAIKFTDRGAASQIARMTEEIGAAVCDDTVRRWLKKIPDALESRMK